MSLATVEDVRPLLIGLVVGTLTLALPRPGQACSPASCTGGSAWPKSGSVPANLPAIAVRPSTPTTGAPVQTVPFDASLFELVDAADQVVPVTATKADGLWLFAPLAHLTQGGSYTVRVKPHCGSSSTLETFLSWGSFHVTAAAPSPTQLGTLSADQSKLEDIAISDYSQASCASTRSAATVMLHLEPSAELAPWKDSLEVRLLVDGIDKGGVGYDSTTNTYSRSIHALCSDPDQQGERSVSFRALLHGSSVALESNTVDVTLSCEDEGDGGCATRPLSASAEPRWAVLGILLFFGLCWRRAARCAKHVYPRE